MIQDIQSLQLIKNVDEFLNTHKRGDQIILNAFTKIDKLKQNDLQKIKKSIPYRNILFQTLKKRGMEDLQNAITGYLFGN